MASVFIGQESIGRRWKRVKKENTPAQEPLTPKRTLKNLEGKFISPDDFIDYKITVHHRESMKKINELFASFMEEVLNVIESDRIATESEGAMRPEHN